MFEASATRTDIAAGNWLERRLPHALVPYARLMRLDRPIGTWLLLLPGWWSLVLAANARGEAPSLWLMALFAVGALVMRGAGCTYNDIVDRDIDAKVARTAERPLPSGAVSVEPAWAFLMAQLVLGLIILLQFNRATIWLGVVSLALVFTYPFMKRITYWPQLWLGLTFNWGALMGWTAVTGSLSLAAFLLYVAGVFWTLGYDTIYAHQDKDDDALIGVKSSALALGGQSRPFIATCYALTMLLMLAAAAAAATVTWAVVALLLICALHLFWQAATLDIDDPQNCLVRFRSNRDFGLFVLLVMIIVQP